MWSIFQYLLEKKHKSLFLFFRREQKYKNEFRNQNIYNFNKFYSRPHKLTPEEMERFYKYKNFTMNYKLFFSVIGFMLFAVYLEIYFMR